MKRIFCLLLFVPKRIFLLGTFILSLYGMLFVKHMSNSVIRHFELSNHIINAETAQINTLKIELAYLANPSRIDSIVRKNLHFLDSISQHQLFSFDDSYDDADNNILQPVNIGINSDLKIEWRYKDLSDEYSILDSDDQEDE